MRIAGVGAGAVGGYFGAFLARGAHGEAIRSNGLTLRGPLGEFTVHAPVSESTGGTGPVELVLHAVKSYDNATALPLLPPLVGDGTVVLTLQNGVDGPDEA